MKSVFLAIYTHKALIQKWLVPVCNDGTALGATYFDSFRCQQNYWCWLATLTDGTEGFSAVKEKVVLKVNVALGTSEIGGTAG